MADGALVPVPLGLPPGLTPPDAECRLQLRSGRAAPVWADEALTDGPYYVWPAGDPAFAVAGEYQLRVDAYGQAFQTDVTLGPGPTADQTVWATVADVLTVAQKADLALTGTTGNLAQLSALADELDDKAELDVVPPAYQQAIASMVITNDNLEDLAADTGYVWVVLDQDGRIGLGLTLDGTLVAKLALPPGAVDLDALAAEVTSLFPTPMPGEGEEVFTVADSTGRASDLSITSSGHLPDRVLDYIFTRGGELGLAAGAPVPFEVTDAIFEWWIGPLATALDDGRTVGGGYGTDGAVKVWQDTPPLQVTVATTPTVDDHNHPAVWAKTGHRTVVIWAPHNADDDLHVKVSDLDGDLRSMVNAPEVLVDCNGSTSYAQVFHVEADSTPAADVLWVLTRVGTLQWAVVGLSVDQASGEVTKLFEQLLLDTASGNQCYITAADAYELLPDQRIRLAFGYNPAQPLEAVYYLELDVVTGAVTNPMDVTVAGNVRTGVGLPLFDSTMTPALPEPASAISRRLHYVRSGPMPPAILIAEGLAATPDEWNYKLCTMNVPGAAWTVTDLGPAGPAMPYTDAANYLSGCSFPIPALDDRVAVARQLADGSAGVLEEWRTVAGLFQGRRLAKAVGHHISRPVYAVNGGHQVLYYAEVFDYDGPDDSAGLSFGDFTSTLRSVRTGS